MTGFGDRLARPPPLRELDRTDVALSETDSETGATTGVSASDVNGAAGLALAGGRRGRLLVGLDGPPGVVGAPGEAVSAACVTVDSSVGIDCGFVILLGGGLRFMTGFDGSITGGDCIAGGVEITSTIGFRVVVRRLAAGLAADDSAVGTSIFGVLFALGDRVAIGVLRAVPAWAFADRRPRTPLSPGGVPLLATSAGDSS